MSSVRVCAFLRLYFGGLGLGTLVLTTRLLRANRTDISAALFAHEAWKGLYFFLYYILEYICGSLHFDSQCSSAYEGI